MGVLAPALLGVVVAGDRAVARGGARGGAARGRRLRARRDGRGVAVLPPERRRDRAIPIFPFGYGDLRRQQLERRSGPRSRRLLRGVSRDARAEARRRRVRLVASRRCGFRGTPTMAPYAFEKVGRFAYDVGPFLLAFVPGSSAAAPATRGVRSSPASALAYARSSCSACGRIRATSIRRCRSSWSSPCRRCSTLGAAASRAAVVIARPRR